MLTIFDKINIQEFHTYFDDEEKCLAFLAEEKWAEGYVCRHCGNTKYCAGKTPFSRRCTRCKKEESATAHTIFHRCKINLPEAFRLAHMVCSSPKISTLELSERLEIRQMTCWKFKKKVTQCIESRTDVSEKGKIELKEIILGTKLTRNG
jgi:hypothetical protein